MIGYGTLGGVYKDEGWGASMVHGWCLWDKGGVTFFSKKAVVLSVCFTEPPTATACHLDIKCEASNEAMCIWPCNRASFHWQKKWTERPSKVT